MRLVVIGCEYAGKTTLACGIAHRVAADSGSAVRVHDHWVPPGIWDQDPATCHLIGPDGVLPERARYGGLGGVERDRLASAHADPVLSRGDAERVLRRYAYQFDASLIRRKIEIDTTGSTPDQALDELLRRMEAYS